MKPTSTCHHWIPILGFGLQSLNPWHWWMVDGVDNVPVESTKADELATSGSHTTNSNIAQDGVMDKATMPLNIDQGMVVQDDVDTTFALNQVESNPNQEVNITNPLDATIRGNDHEDTKVNTLKKGGSSKPIMTRNNGKGSITTKLSKSSSSGMEQKSCKSSSRHCSLRGRSQKSGILSQRLRKY